MAVAQMVYDQDDILTFQQGGEAVDAYDASVNAITTVGVSTDVLDLEVVAPNHIGRSIYMRPLQDVAGTTIDGTGDPVVVLDVKTGDTSTPDTTLRSVTQSSQDEAIEIPLPKGLERYLSVLVKSDGGGASNSISTGAVQVWIGESGQLA